ncbi:MAG: lytic transglycosylase domain-containing protein [Pseudomonadota bacterium]|nr:lytic transglycosylase domain-containing protein [Pseudomonadota bacterium]
MNRFPLSILIGLPLAVLAAGQANASETAGSTGGADTTDETSEAAAEPPAGNKVVPPTKKPAPSKSQLKPMIDRTAKNYGVERELVHAVIAAESAYNAHAVSRAGAIGLMQVMPATAADYGVTSTEALFEPKVNVKTGTRHLKRLLGKYRNDYGRVIMAYNAGEGVVDRTNSNVTYAETLDYTAAVIRQYRRNGGKQPTEEAMRKVSMLRRISGSGKARRLMKKYLDPSLLSLKVRPTLPIRYLDPGLHNAGPKSRPMIVLESPKTKN